MKSKSFLILVPLLAALLQVTHCGKAVLAGGAITYYNADVYVPFINMSTSSSGEQYIGIITAGISWDIAEKTATAISNRLTRTYGATRVEWLPFHPDNPDNGDICSGTSLNDKLNEMTGIYFNGGDTYGFIECFFPNGEVTPALALIQERYNKSELAIMGVSAGVLIFQRAPYMFSRESWKTLANGPTFDKKGGFDLFSYGFLDVHFSERGREGRLIRMVTDQRQYSTLGFGIDQDTAIVIDGDSFEVVGTRGVYMIDVLRAVKGTGERFSVEGVKVNFLSKGDTYNLKEGRITVANYKRYLTGDLLNNEKVEDSFDIFGNSEFRNLTMNLFKSNASSTVYGYTIEDTPQFRVDFRKTENSLAFIGTFGGLEHLTLYSLEVDISCYQNC